MGKQLCVLTKNIIVHKKNGVALYENIYRKNRMTYSQVIRF